jgi:hypothetical protein
VGAAAARAVDARPNRGPRVRTQSKYRPPRSGEMLAPVLVIQARGRDLLAARRGVHEAVVADINADVRVTLAFLMEEQEIARADLLPGDGSGAGPLSFRVSRQVQVDAGIAVLYQPAAVETSRRVAAGPVRFALHAERVLGGVGAGLQFGLPRRRRTTAKDKQDKPEGSWE